MSVLQLGFINFTCIFAFLRFFYISLHFAFALHLCECKLQKLQHDKPRAELENLRVYFGARHFLPKLYTNFKNYLIYYYKKKKIYIQISCSFASKGNANKLLCIVYCVLMVMVMVMISDSSDNCNDAGSKDIKVTLANSDNCFVHREIL